MTFQGDQVKASNSVLKALVVTAILLIAWWAARGGYESIPAQEPTATTIPASTDTTLDP